MAAFVVCLFTFVVWTLGLNSSSALPPVFDVDVIIKVVYVPSDTAPGTVIYRLVARDLQSRPDYPIVFTLSGDNSSYFSIEPVDKLDANLVLKSSLTRGLSYSLTITATDSALEGSPKFGLAIQLAGRDTIKGDILVHEKLNYKEQSSYLLTITAMAGYREPERDTRNIIIQQLTVTVQENQAPVFAQLPLLTKVPADKNVGETVFTIKAQEGSTSTSASINYRIQGQYRRFFRMDSVGKVTVAAPLNELLVNCQDSPVVLEVRAEETGTGASTTSEIVVVVQNPAATIVSFTANTFRATLNENVPAHTRLIFETTPQVTIQAECGIIQLELKGIAGQLSAPTIFEVKPNILLKSGAFQIVVKDPMPLDYEHVKEIRFEITAQNLRMPNSAVSRATIIVAINDLNDNSPVFTEERYYVRIPENAQQNTHIAHVTATDADSGKFGTVRYTNVYSNGLLSENLRLNRETGQITLTTSNHGLDREKQAQHIITVEAQDNEGIGGHTTSAQIQVHLQDINDNPPLFPRSDFYFCLPDSLRSGQVFWIASAVDGDESDTANSMIQYSMITTNEFFQMTTQGIMALTRDASGISGSQNIDLVIRASDMGIPSQSSQATVHVSLDKNTCQQHALEYFVDGHASTVQSKRAQMERLLTDLNGGSITKIDSITDIDSNSNGGSQAVSANNSASNSVARTKIVVTVLQQGNNSVVDLTALTRFNDGEA